MVRVITQETFDSVVKENIEDLELSPEEAIEDAVKQFQAQVQHPAFFNPDNYAIKFLLGCRSH
jgi:hypothetical protein